MHIFFGRALIYVASTQKKISKFYVVKFCDMMPQSYSITIQMSWKCTYFDRFWFLMYYYDVTLGHPITKFHYIKSWKLFLCQWPIYQSSTKKIWFASFNGKGVSALNKSTRLILLICPLFESCKFRWNSETIKSQKQDENKNVFKVED